MAGNRFNIPTFDLDLLNWANNARTFNANRARERQQDWNNVFGAAAGLGKQIRAEQEAEKARQAAAEQAALRELHQDVQAEIQRNFQADEAEKARKFQGEQREMDRKAQREYNEGIRALEQAKLDKKEMDAAQILYGNLLAKESNTPGEQAQMRQIENKWPGIGNYKDKQGNVRSMREDVDAQNESKAKKDYEFALFKASLPTTFNKKNPKAKTILEIQNGTFSDGTPFTQAQRTELLNYVNNIKDQKAKTNEAVQGAIASAAASKTTEKINETDNKNKALSFVGTKMNKLSFEKIPEEQRKYLSLSTNGIVAEKK